MKKFINKLFRGIAGTKIMLLAIVIVPVSGIYAQEKESIKGILIERKTNQAVPYATVALIRVSDSTMINGAVSDENGVFNISPVNFENYRLRVSTIGYKPAIKSITIANRGVTDVGIIYLQDTATVLQELVIVGDRVKAKSESDRTTFFMTKKILDASSTGMDVLKLIPGIQVDFMQNISLEGSSNIQIFVDGKERDRSFMSQLNPKQIEKIEVISKPTSNYDGNTTGAINIILKRESNSGIMGQFCAEIPTSFSEIYIHPTCTLTWGFKKLTLNTSYKGDMTYLDIHETTVRKVWKSAGTNEIISNQYVSQKDWSHRFNFGIDYFITTHDQLSFYAFYNPFSRELSGNVDLEISGSVNNHWQAKKEDSDINSGAFSSLYYKHNFNREGRDISIEISKYHLRAKNSTAYVSEGNLINMPVQTNTSEPGEDLMSIKIDYTSNISKELDFCSGVKAKFQDLQDACSNDFQYDEKILAAYGTITYKHAKYFLSMGLRAEESVANLKNNFSNTFLSFFPNATFSYKLTPRQSFQISYNRSIQRPTIYQLNPHAVSDDPFTVNKGNPFLEPEFRNSFFLEYSIRFKSNYIASRLFYNKLTDVINDMTVINDTGAFETQVHNMGIIHQYGIQFSGTLKIWIVTFNPFLQLFDLYTSGNSLAKQNGIENRHNLAFNSGLSAILSFKHDFSFSFVFQYASPKNDIQANSFCGALYFLSLEKTIKQKIKIGIVCALPFSRSFTYAGSEFDRSGFSSHYEGNVKISNPFCWIKFCYQFSNGRKKEATDRGFEEIDNLPKKGF